MNGRTLLASFLACLVAFAAPAARAAADGQVATPLAGTDAGPQLAETPLQALAALEAEREEAIAAFDWGARADYGERLLAYNRMLLDFARRDLALREARLLELGRVAEAERLRAERERSLAAVEPQPQLAPHPAPQERSAPAEAGGSGEVVR